MQCRYRLIGFVGAISALTLSACGATTGPSPETCALAPMPPALVYPLDGGTNVPDGNFTLVLTQSAAHVSLEISNVVAVADLQSAPIPNPIPSPASTASPGAAYAVPVLRPSTTYEVFGVYPLGGCHPSDYTPPPSPIGSFTTK